MIFFCQAACPEGYAWALVDPTADQVTAFGVSQTIAQHLHVPRPDGAIVVSWSQDPTTGPAAWRVLRGELDFDTLNYALEVFQPGNPPAADPVSAVPRLLTMATVLRKWHAVFYLAKGKWTT